MTFGIVVAEFNAHISDALLEGARRYFREHAIADDAVSIVHVPGAYEIPLAAKTMALTNAWSAVICLGAVIRGETAHFEYVAGECARGLQQVSLDTGVPMIFGVLTTENLAQAEARSGADRTNKGYECANAAVAMVTTLQSIKRTL